MQRSSETPQGESAGVCSMYCSAASLSRSVHRAGQWVVHTLGDIAERRDLYRKQLLRVEVYQTAYLVMRRCMALKLEALELGRSVKPADRPQPS